MQIEVEEQQTNKNYFLYTVQTFLSLQPSVHHRVLRIAQARVHCISSLLQIAFKLCGIAIFAL